MGTPTDPAAGSPVPVRAAQATVPGGPSFSGPPLEGEGGNTSPAACSPPPRALTGPRAAGDSLSSPQLRRERAAAERPTSGAGADAPLLGSAPGQRRTSAPAGGALASTQADSVPPDRSRTYTITLPAGLRLLNANDRDGHWARRKRVTEELREAAGWAARAQHIPGLQRAHVLGIYEPPDLRRRDPANLYPSFKACVDGLVDAGVLVDDDASHLDGPDMRLGEVCRKGRLVLRVTEIAATGGSAA